MLDKIKNLVKKLVYKLGVLSAFHTARNKNTLTVVLFHRVLPVDDARWKQADMDWTVSDIFYNDCLVFFNRHYNVISYDDLEQSINSSIPLPDRALLVTFDDGWSDNIDYAEKISRLNQVRPLLFVTTSSIGKKILSWQEALYSSWRMGLLSDEWVRKISSLAEIDDEIIKNESHIRLFINTLQKSSSDIKEKFKKSISELEASLPGKNQMLNASELKKLYRSGFSMGTHGVIHEPYNQIESALRDMRESRNQLAEIIDASPATSMSFPHGVENHTLIESAIEAGYTSIFTGRSHLNKLKYNEINVYGRFNIEQCDLEDPSGRLNYSKMALYLFRRAIK